MKNLGNRYYLMAVQYCEYTQQYVLYFKIVKITSNQSLCLQPLPSPNSFHNDQNYPSKWGTPVTKNVIIFLQQEALQTLTYYTFQSCSYQTPFLPYFLLQAITVPAILQIHPELFFAIPKPKIPFYYLLLTAFPIFYSQPNPNAFLTMELSQSGALPIL